MFTLIQGLTDTDKWANIIDKINLCPYFRFSTLLDLKTQSKHII